LGQGPTYQYEQQSFKAYNSRITKFSNVQCRQNAFINQ
jgi:hypothetical protein